MPIDIMIYKGRTFEFSYRYAQSDLVYRAISGMPSTAPVRFIVTAHGIPDGWPVRIENLEGFDCTEDLFATVVDPDTIELNSVNATCWRPYRTGGNVAFCKPFDLTGYTAKAWFRDRVGGTPILKVNVPVDIAMSSFELRIEAEDTETLPWRRGVYDIEATGPNGDTYPVVPVSRVSVESEVTE